jgi:hypothetical protein
VLRTKCLNEAESLAWLEAGGLPVVSHVVCQSAGAARQAFERLGGPVAIKGCSADVPHKSDVGLVVLDVDNVDAAVTSYDAIAAKLAVLGARSAGVIVAKMIDGLQEVALGARVDPVFGPVIMVSGGGRYVEAVPDTALLMTPFTLDAARAAWRSLRMAPLFDGVRGEPPLDLDALCAVTVRFGQIVSAQAAVLSSIDLNPIIVRRAGAGVVIVDALVERV